ncbi:transglycosylase domain-containing protein [Aeromicrobium sp. UC242_57]|uniref:transglycosylase domain-containing protein n=1 Tax=Aeromicrobium sp. UC242_57 TaxID=3374624 RepID=UPI0037A4C402
MGPHDPVVRLPRSRGHLDAGADVLHPLSRDRDPRRECGVPDPDDAGLLLRRQAQAGEFATQDRESIPLDDIPASMQAAAIAAEDRSFYTNRGLDFKGILRAVRDNTTSGSIQGGGSTITQQYVKILYLTQERSYTRKVKEAILSIKIHNQLTKSEILEGYLNTIYFGNGAYGVEVAAQTYFNKPASKLNYAQSALLATIINSPS